MTRETRVQPASTLQEQVRQTYAAAALAVTRRGPACCEGSADGDQAEPAAVTLYSAVDRDQLPGDAIAASLGCGNPTAIADLRNGDIVLDLAPAAASTYCCPPAESARPAKRTGWT